MEKTFGDHRPLPGDRGLYEVRFHGRGGQGTVVASVLLAKAAFLEGRGVQAFPFFGVERRGAPVVAYTRIGSGPVRLGGSITNPDALIVMDTSLLVSLKDTWLQGLRPGGHVLLNRPTVPEELRQGSDHHKIRCIDAGSIALRHHLGSPSNPLVNTVILGAFARMTGIVSLEALEEAVRTRVPGQLRENLEALNEAWETVEVS
ncbi:MAG: 2-oxoacid:acceptor oxidoreductase family protein [Candidatus Thermoplasmatota archaeon]|jgi:2-oxoacid:acceptor oxidoreductase gamma subunit (pyruvate/2-ketoisovalerate family)|nr:2-oxoacid:acceptor oxidoreductase family protein [Candidatus Thermoplasmatota archaeon]MCL5984612.1 2-oxoacid:acceptor oxidoreductase family protein [Candidatus Thermoplasmatota archaeon]